MNERTNGRTDERTDRRTDTRQRTNERTNRRTLKNERTDGRKDGRMDRRTHTSQQTDELSFFAATCRHRSYALYTFWKNALQKISETGKHECKNIFSTHLPGALPPSWMPRYKIMGREAREAVHLLARTLTSECLHRSVNSEEDLHTYRSQFLFFSEFSNVPFSVNSILKVFFFMTEVLRCFFPLRMSISQAKLRVSM